MDEFDDILDQRITESFAGESQGESDASEETLGGYEKLAAEISRVFLEESPRLSPSAQTRQLAELRGRARSKRAGRELPGLGFLRLAPRWAQIAAIALVVVLIANGISIASASSLPGSPLYPFKRLTEQGNVLLTPTAGERARIWMSLASIRLDEVQRLVAERQRVDSATLDGIDQSILNALSEIAGTRGSERVALLEALTQLTMRQQDVLSGLSEEAAPADRGRFEDTERLLGGVATFAGAARADPGLTPDPSGTVNGAQPTATFPPSPSLRPTMPTAPMSQVIEDNTNEATRVRPTESSQPDEGPSPEPKDNGGPQASPTGTAPEQQKENTTEAPKTESGTPQKEDAPSAPKSDGSDNRPVSSPDG